MCVRSSSGAHHTHHDTTMRVHAQFLLINGCEEIVSAIQVAAGQTLSPSDQLQELLVQLVREVPSMRLVMTSRVEALGYKSECCFTAPYKSDRIFWQASHSDVQLYHGHYQRACTIRSSLGVRETLRIRSSLIVPWAPKTVLPSFPDLPCIIMPVRQVSSLS